METAGSPSLELQSQLETCPLGVQEYATALQNEIIACRKKCAQLEAQFISVRAENSELKKELERKKDISRMSDGELQCLKEYHENLLNNRN